MTRQVCFRCHIIQHDVFRIIDKVFCIVCYEKMLAKIDVMLEKEKLPL